MATAASSVASVAAAPNPSSSGGRPQLKGSMGGSNSGSGNPRRATQSPIDGPQRRNSSHKAWQTNPGQKYNGSTTPASSAASPTPSQAAAMKARTPSASQGAETDTQDKHMHDRTVYLLSHLMSRKVTATVRSGARYIGYLSGVDTKSHDMGIVLKWARLQKAALGDEDKAKEGDFVGGGPEKSLIIEPKDLVDVHAEKIVLGDTDVPYTSQQNGTTTGFKTDADISGNLASRERELQRWHQPEETVGGLELEDNAAGGGWNQFEANERLFGVKSDFDENIYTTKLDRSHPLYQQREAAAAKIVAELEGQAYNNSMNPHVAEERGLAVPDDSGMDEEDKYSGVQRGVPASSSSNNPNRYTPPALRAPTGQPTVPGAPHDPAIIASQLVRPETVQQKQPPLPIPQINAPKTADEAGVKPKERPGLPELGPGRNQAGNTGPSKPTEAPQIEKEVSLTFKNFVSTEKERVKKKRADMVTRDRESKLRELKKFSESFMLKTEVPKDLVPILAKEKVKQEEIINKAKQNLTKTSTGNVPMASGPSTAASTTATSSPMAPKIGGKVPPPGSFAAKDPERFEREKQNLLRSLPATYRDPQPSLSRRIQQIERGGTVRAPVPIPESGRTVFPPTGPSNNMPSATTAPSTGPKRLSVTAASFKPNPNAVSFTPTLGGPSTTATPSPTTSTHAYPTSRANSPSIFFGNKKVKAAQDKPSIRDDFNPFKRMKASKPEIAQAGGSTSNDYIDKPWIATPTWPTTEENKEKSYKQMFGNTDGSNGIHSPQPPHMMPPQPHHQQLPPHMPPHIPHGPHVPQQPHHGGPMQQHLGIPPPHYDQDPHIRQISTPSSVMPSPSLHNATVAAPYQPSPVPHHIAMYPAGQQGMGQYGVPSAPGGQYGYYNNSFRGNNGAPGMMVHGSQPMPYGAPMGNQFMHPQMYSPQQPHAYMNNGPPPPGSQGFPSPRPAAAPMMMHQGSSQGAPGGAQMVPYGMSGQGGPMYAQGQQPQMGMMRGQMPPPPHQGGPPPQFYHGPQQAHYPPGSRGNAYVGPQGQPGGPHGGPPPPVQQLPPQQQQQQQQQGAEGAEEGK